jgi:hypothetical protein
MSKSDEQLLEEVKEIEAVFSPRQHWASGPYGLVYEDTFALMYLLHELREAGHVALNYQHISAVSFEEQLAYREESEYERNVRAVASQRRSPDLRDETWSGYLHLKSLYPEQQFETFYGGIPYLYLDRESGTACTAGNVQPERILEFVVRHAVSRLCIVGDLHSWREEDPLGNDDHFDMAVLTLDSEARTEIDGFFSDRSRALLDRLNGVVRDSS